MISSISSIAGGAGCSHTAASASSAQPRPQASSTPSKQDTVHLSQAAKAALDKDNDGDSH